MPTTITETVALRLYTGMQLAFEQAMKRLPDRVHELHYIFGGSPVRFRIVGSEMASQITRPFSHLRTDGSITETPRLSVDLWDESETGMRCQFGSTNGDAKHKKMTAVSSEGQLIGQRLRNVLTYYNAEMQHILSSVVWAGELSAYERWKPLARPLLEWHNNQNIRMIHGSLVAQNGQGVLFSGKSGSGKSTAALACVGAGFHFLSEDYVGLQELPGGSFLGHSLYNSVFLERDHLNRFPELASYAMTGLGMEKSTVVLSQVFPDRLARNVPIRVLALPRIVNTKKPKFYPASKGEALLALGPSSLLQIPNRRLGATGFSQMAQLVERVPCYWLELACDLTTIPKLVGDLLAELS